MSKLAPRPIADLTSPQLLRAGWPSKVVPLRLVAS